MNKALLALNVPNSTVTSYPASSPVAGASYTKDAENPYAIQVDDFSEGNGSQFPLTYVDGQFYFVDKANNFIARVVGVSWRAGNYYTFILNRTAPSAISAPFELIREYLSHPCKVISARFVTGAGTAKIYSSSQLATSSGPYNDYVSLKSGMPPFVLRQFTEQAKGGYVEPVLVVTDGTSEVEVSNIEY